MTDLPETMRGVQLIGHGDLDKLAWREDIPVPRPGPGDVLIRVGGAAVNNTDINTRTGWYSKSGSEDDASWAGVPLGFPRIQGIDACGRIVAVGEGVDAARIGARVLVEPCIREANGEMLAQPWYLGSECDGGFAEYLRIAARHAHRIESGLSDTELATFPCSYSTAENMLCRADLKAGERVLVTGASGGVGSAAVQLARARGAEVVAVTGAAKAEAVQALGAARTIGRGDDPVAAVGESAVDLVVDLVGGAAWPRLLDVIRPGGRYAVSGAIAGPIVSLDLRTLYLKDLTLFGCTALGEGVFASLVGRIERGEVKPLVGATFALRDIAEAQRTFLEKAHLGKIALEV